MGDKMQKKIIIDNRMRSIEKAKLKELGYEILKLKENNNLYPEISSHVDIHACKVGEKIVIEPTQYEYVVSCKGIVKGQEIIKEKYPLDIKYNVCTIGKKAIHNFQYTDSKLKQLLVDNGYELINTTQGYTNCSIAVIDDNSAIVSDQGLYKILKFHGIEVLLVNNNLDVKLFNGNKYSDKKGFIGGCVSSLGESIIVFGDLNKIDSDGRIREFITSKNLNIIEFESLEVIDYGGIIWTY